MSQPRPFRYELLKARERKLYQSFPNDAAPAISICAPKLGFVERQVSSICRSLQDDSMPYHPVDRALRALERPLRKWVPAWRERPGGFLPPNLLEKVDEAGVLFVHIPKCGGTSITTRLYGCKIQHRPALELLLFHPRKFQKWLKIAVIREPIDRFLSAYDFLRQGGTNESSANFGLKYVASYDDINAFVFRLRETDFRRSVLGYFHFRPQIAFITVLDRVLVNRLVRFDHMDEDLEATVGLRQVPRANVTKGKRTPQSALDEEALALIKKLYQKDFRLWELAQTERGDVFRHCI